MPNMEGGEIKSELNTDGMCTPLRVDPVFPRIPGWNIDPEKSINSNVDLPPSTDPDSTIKRSPNTDGQATPLRAANFSEDEMDLESRPDANGLSAPITELINEISVLMPPMPDVKVEKQEPVDLGFGFLDDLVDVDFDGISNDIRSRKEPIDGMDLEPSKMEQPSSDEDEELRALQREYEQLREKLRRKDEKCNKNEEKENDKKRKRKKGQKKSKSRRSHSKSPESSHKKQRTNETNRTFKADPDDYVPVQNCERHINVVDISKILLAKPVPAQKLNIKEKRKLALENVKSVLELMERKALKIPETEFLVVDTIKKLPSSASVLSSANFENPSPLCNNFNVKYKFNSTTSNINLSKWGLDTMPKTTADLLKLTGIDVGRLFELMQNSKMPLSRQRLKDDSAKAASRKDGDDIFTGLFRSLSTQTDRNIGIRTKDAAVQAMPSSTQNPEVFWQDSQFCEADLSYQQAKVVFALKELCASMPSSTYWADSIYQALCSALAIKREEVKQLAAKQLYSCRK